MYGPRGSIVSNDIPWVNQQMPGVPENLAMDKEISFAKKNRITISNNAAILLLVAFFACIAATGLLVYYLAPCSGESIPTANEILITTNDTAEAGWTTTTDAVVGTTGANTEDDPTTSVADITPGGRGVPAPSPPRRDVRLPRSVRPREYDINIVPYLKPENFSFTGDVRILVNVTEPTSNITLHANALLIDEGATEVFSLERNNTIPITKYAYDKELQFFIMHFAEEIPPGEYSIYAVFSGILDDALQGFYKCSYKKGTENRWIAATQFQPTDARRAFPCFDEPSLKATFQLSISRPNEMTSISNMPKIKSEPSTTIEGYTTDHFQKSVPMSTYLVAFFISDFKSKSNGNFSVWARADALDQTSYSLEIGPQVLKYYETFFDIPFPLPKIDMVAVPDFSSGAMENWGLITYRESNLLYEDGVSSKRNKQSIAIVVAHELAHQWFGNLVTPTWWTDLWLNEGFASYLEYVGVDAVNPSWKMLDQFIIYELQLVFSLDALKSSHQVSIEVNNPDEVNDIFDKISYGKGATLIRMMEHFLSTDVFKRGLTKYLNDRKYGSANQDDLWMSLTNQAHEDGALEPTMSVKEIMDTWTLQTGFPVVTVNRNYEDNSVTLTQERFLLDRSTNSTTLWWIPVTFTDLANNFGHAWMRGVPELTFHVNTSSGDWLLFNVNQTGYYRVNYDDNNWRMIIAQLNRKGGHLKFDPKNRAQIVDDALNLANAGYLDYDIAMDLTSYLTQEKDFVPWNAALKGFDFIYEMFLRSGHFDKYKSYLLKLITPLYYEVGYRDYPSDPLLLTYVRLDILQRACALGFVDCISNAARLFQNWKAAPDPDRNNPISPNLRNIVYCTAIRGGGEEEWDFAWERYLKTNVGTEKDLLLAALACTRESWLLNKYLEMSVTPNSGIKKQDAPRVFAAVARNIVGQPLAFKYLTSNWDSIRDYMGSSFMLLNNLIRSVTLHFNSEQEADDLRNFALRKSKDLQNTSRSINQAIEQTEANIAWMKKYFEKISAWLDKHNDGGR